MADKKSRSSIPSRPPPPPTAPKSPKTGASAAPVTADLSITPISNGVAEKPNKAGIPSKPKPPGKPFKITRAFSSGSMTFGRKSRKKSKNDGAESMGPDEEVDTVSPAKNELNKLQNGSDEQEEKDALWKLPGIEAASKGKLRSKTSEASLMDRELPPVPSEEPMQDSRVSLENRELPPLPAAQSPSAAPLPVANSGTDNEQPSNAVSSTSASDNVNGLSTYINVQSTGKDDINSRPLPGTPPNAEECDLNASNFRPLPQTPPVSDCDEEPADTKPKEEFNGVIEADQLSSETKGNKVEKEISQDSQIENTASNEDVSSKSSLTSSDPATSQQAEASEDLRDYKIGEIINTYSYALPVCVKILQGYCSDTTEVNISTDDVYNIHSVQHIKKLMVKDEDGMTHRVSLEAPVKLGLVFNPRNNSDESLNGYILKTVADMTALPVLPKVVAATRTVTSADEKHSITEGEVFVVRNIQRSMFKGKKGLKMFSLLSNSIKVLSDDCQGNFSTKPSLVKMNLPDLLEKVPDIYPSRCVIYPTTDDVSHNADFPGTLSRVVTLLECNTDTVLVVSDVSFLTEKELEEAISAPLPLSSPTSFDLLLDDDISNLEVAVMKWTYPEEETKKERYDGAQKEELEHLYDDTADLKCEIQGSNEDLNRSQGQVGSTGGDVPPPVPKIFPEDHTYINLHGTTQKPPQQLPQQLPLQQQQPLVTNAGPERWVDKEKQFYEEDEDAGYDTVGLHLIGSNQQLSDKSPINPQNPVAGGGDGPFAHHGYSTVHQKRFSVKDEIPSSGGYSTASRHTTSAEGVVTEVVPEKSTDKKVGETVGVATGEESQISTMMESLESRLKSFQNTQQTTEIAKMQSMLEKLTLKLETVDSQLNTLAASPKTASKEEASSKAAVVDKESATAEKSPEECNRDFLKTLDEKEVGRLMEAMSLGQYSNKILSEQISGEILMECDESVLQDEIGVTSKIHRIRILKIISGQHSAKALLEKLNN